MLKAKISSHWQNSSHVSFLRTITSSYIIFNILFITLFTLPLTFLHFIFTFHMNQPQQFLRVINKRKNINQLLRYIYADQHYIIPLLVLWIFNINIYLGRYSYELLSRVLVSRLKNEWQDQKKLVLFPEMGRVKKVLSFTRTHSRMCISIYVFNLKKLQKNKKTKS